MFWLQGLEGLTYGSRVERGCGPLGGECWGLGRTGHLGWPKGGGCWRP